MSFTMFKEKDTVYIVYPNDTRYPIAKDTVSFIEYSKYCTYIWADGRQYNVDRCFHTLGEAKDYYIEEARKKYEAKIALIKDYEVLNG